MDKKFLSHSSFLNSTEILYVCMCLYVFRYMYTYMLKCVWRPREHFRYHPKEHHLPPLTHSLSCCWSSPIRVDPSGHWAPVFVSPVCGYTWFLHGTGDLIQVLDLQGKLLYQLRQRHILRPIVNILGTVQRIIQPLPWNLWYRKYQIMSELKVSDLVGTMRFPITWNSTSTWEWQGIMEVEEEHETGLQLAVFTLRV